MNQLIRTILYITVFGLVVTGCSGSSNSNKRKPIVENKVNGYVGNSNIFKSTIYAVPIDVQGQPKLAEDDSTKFAGTVTITNSKAYFVATVSEQDSFKPVVFIANALPEDKTTQRCELVEGCGNIAFGANYALGESFKLNAAVSSVDDNSRVNINWITHLASDIAYTAYIDDNSIVGAEPSTIPVEGMFTPFTIESGNIWLTKQFNISDIIGIRPIAPSALNEVQDLVAGLREQGIRYGALLAGGQKLAQDEGITDAAWLSAVVKQQRGLKGQLYTNHASEFSLCTLYTAAKSVLDTNILRANGLAADVKRDANSALDKLAVEENKYCSKPPGQPTSIVVNVDEVEDWVDSFKQAREFVDDLNGRILNMRCDVIKQDGEENLEGFFDCDYVKRTQAYYKDLEMLYRTNKQELIDALHAMRNEVTAFTECLNGGTATTCANNEYTVNGLTYTMVPLEETAVKEGGITKYYAFDFRVSGKRDITSKISITFNKPKKVENKEIEITAHNLIRVVYQGDEAYKVPAKIAFEDKVNGTPPTAGVEPFGFDFNFPDVELNSSVAAYPQKDFKLYFSAKLAGVKPLLDPNKAVHYNLSEVGVGFNIQGVKLGDIIEKNEKIDLKDTAEFTFKAKFDDALNFYAKSLWPDRNDYFTADSGIAPQSKIDAGTGMFQYALKQNQNILISASTNEDGSIADEIYGNADYLQLNVAGLGLNRYEKYKSDEKYQFRNCFIDGSNDETKKICGKSETVPADFSLIKDVIYSEENYFGSFAVPGYGAYSPNIQTGIDWGDVGSWNGILDKEFVQGVTDIELRVAQEFVDVSAGKVERAPAAILKIEGFKKTDTRWELAASMGYNYEYLIDVLPAGIKNTQSFYFSYYVNEYTRADGSKDFISEIGSLSVIREGTKLFGLEEGATINATLASRVDYEIDKTSTDLCGYTKVVEKGAKAKTCNAIAYLTVRGKLVGTLRIENGAYVMRYSDGTFSILGI